MILLVRGEIICIVILLYLLAYSLLYIEGIKNTRFIRMNYLAIGHVVFDLITLCTVNNIGNVSPVINKYAHIIFYYFAILFCYEALIYTVENVLSNRSVKIICNICRGIIIIYFLSAPFLKITYLQGNGTFYSFGPCVYAGYALAMILSLASLIFLLLHIKKIAKKPIIALLPMFLAMILCMLIQIIVPEFLFTGGGITIVTVGVFFTYENPARKFREKAYTDIYTGVKNRNLFNEDYERYKQKFNASGSSESSMGIVLCDLNGLKITNDTYGHAAGDQFIRVSAQILSEELKGSAEVYRIGGDEFAAFYLNAGKEAIEAEIAAVYQRFELEKSQYPFRLSAAIGYAITNEGRDLDATYKEADLLMYETKKKMKAQGNNTCH